MIPKFRAWKKINTQEMLNDVRAIDFDKRMIKIGYPLSRDTTRIDTESLDNVKLMLSTSLKDISGTEIYEGDIVELKYPYDKRIKSKGVIVRNDNKACFGISMKETTEQYELYRITAENYLTVIGNVHQNPELLEESQ